MTEKTWETAREDHNGASAPAVLLRAGQLHKAFGGQVVLDGIDVELREGEVVLLRGENGSGKTTLLNILTGNMEPDAGDIDYLADDSPRRYRFPRRWWEKINPLDHFAPEFVAREGIGRTWQDIRLFSSQSLRDNIAVAHAEQAGERPLNALLLPGRVRRCEERIRAQTDSILARLGLAGREDSSADKISLGQSKRVAIARAIAGGARILFLDEPLAGLDRDGVSDVLALLETLVQEHTVTLVIVEHVFNLHHLKNLATTDWLLKEGKITASRTSDSSTQEIGNPSSDCSRENELLSLAKLVPENATVESEMLARGASLTRIRPHDFNEAEADTVLEIENLVVQRGTRRITWTDEGEK